MMSQFRQMTFPCQIGSSMHDIKNIQEKFRSNRFTQTVQQ